MIRLANNTKVRIEWLAFAQTKARHKFGEVKDGLDDISTHILNDISLSDSCALGLNKDYAILQIENLLSVRIDNAIFTNNIIRALHVTSATVSINNSNFLRYGGAAFFVELRLLSIMSRS